MKRTMSQPVRKYLIAGNWKMFKTASEGVDLVAELDLALGRQPEVAVVVCPPYTALESCARKLEDSNIQLGAQNMYPKAEGAYTGEISPVMLRSLFCTHVILGHSERRQYFAETDTFVNAKVLAALESNLKPIICIGETIDEREAGKTMEIVDSQLTTCLQGVDKEHADNLIIAYEPVWAIGTGRTATPEMAQEVHAFIRQRLVELLGRAAAARIRILYGGSMKPENAAELLDQPDIDGGLIGGASLKARSFIDLVEIARRKS
jgi:triosephosphate isomerase